MPDLTPEQRRTAQEANRAAVALIRAAAESDKAGVLTLSASLSDLWASRLR